MEGISNSWILSKGSYDTRSNICNFWQGQHFAATKWTGIPDGGRDQRPAQDFLINDSLLEPYRRVTATG